MAKEQRLIDADALKNEILSWAVCVNKPHLLGRDETMCVIDNAPTVDAVSRGVHDQVRWERDIAIQQLEEHGIPFGGIAPDVIKVVRCNDCKYSHDHEINRNYRCHRHARDGYSQVFDAKFTDNDFCSYGERRTNGENFNPK